MRTRTSPRAVAASRTARLLSFLIVGGCESSTANVLPLLDALPDEPGLAFDHDWREEELCAVADAPDPYCCTDVRIELPPIAASSLDLRGLTSGAAGTCGDPVKQILPSDAAAYPLMVLLPAISIADPFCATNCAGREKETTFGIVLSLPDALADEYRPIVVAPPPWRYVYGHNSLEGDACLGGYQEFGERACVRLSYGGSIGFATDSLATPVLAALIDLQTAVNGAAETCCPYLPTPP